MKELQGTKILVTGGGGSIGSTLIDRILDADPEVVRVLDHDETALFDLQQRVDDPESIRCLLGDTRTRNRLAMAMEDIDHVIHTAALKHVELNEYNPFEAVQTNVLGTQNAIRAAMDEEVTSFLNVSTDKASTPVSVMGATKLLSERVTVAANTYKGEQATTFGCVRFGNVLGSSGSVIPTFFRQIRDGGPVTVTDPQMTRFLMPLSEAADLVIETQYAMDGGEVFVLKMPAFRVGTLAEAMIDGFAPAFGHDPDEIDVEIVGRRPAERVHEKLISEAEVKQAQELPDRFVLVPEIDLAPYAGTDYSEFASVTDEYTSADAERLSKAELVDIIDEHVSTVTDTR